MNIVQLNAAQQTEVKQLQSALTTAQASVRTAQKALDAFTQPLVQTKSKIQMRVRAQVSDDGTALIVG